MGTQGCFGAARVRARGDGPAKNTWGGVKLEGGEMEAFLFTTGLFFPGSLLTAPLKYFQVLPAPGQEEKSPSLLHHPRADLFVSS